MFEIEQGTKWKPIIDIEKIADKYDPNYIVLLVRNVIG